MFNVAILDIKTASPIFQDVASKAVLPGEEGELSILDFHQPIISCLKEGMIKIDEKLMVITRGVARMKDDQLVVLVERY